MRHARSLHLYCHHHYPTTHASAAALRQALACVAVLLLSLGEARTFAFLPPRGVGLSPARRPAAPQLHLPLLPTGGQRELRFHRHRRSSRRCLTGCVRSSDGGFRGVGGDCGRLHEAPNRRSVVGHLRSSEKALSSPLDQQPYTVVTAWRCEGSAVDIPWRSLYDLLFEMGACSCSMYAGEADDDQQHQQEQEAGAVETVPGSLAAGEAADIEEQDGNGAMLTFIVERRLWGGVDRALEAACTLAGGPDGCFASLDWEEGSVECIDHWEATRSSEGFETVTMRRLQITPVQRDETVPSPSFRQVKLLEGPGWGDGEHPSTWMCLEFLETAIRGGEEVVDYGTGSGVLAAAAAVLGAKHVAAIDIDVEILAHARQNFLVNGISEKVSALHSREVSTGDLSAEIVVANMIAGPMRRQMAALVLAVRDGGLLCLSGLRPSDVPLIRSEFGKYMDWDGGLEMSRETAPFGEYVRLVGRPKLGLAEGGGLRVELEQELSEVAVA